MGAAKPGERTSGTQIWTGRSPCRRNRSRYALTLSRDGLDDCKLIVPRNRTSLSSRLQELLSALQGGEGGTREAGG